MPQTDLRKITTVIGHSFFAIYLLFCCFYFLERTLAFDGAFYCFKMVHSESFNIENGRWGAFYTQLLPLIGLWTGCSLKTFLLLYSLSFGLCNYIVFIVLNHWFRKPAMALAFILSILLGYKYSFYYTVSEIHVTVPVLFLFWGFLDRYSTLSPDKTRQKKILLFVLFALALWAAKTHIISIFVLGFILIFNFLENEKKENWKQYGLLSLGMISIYLIFLLLIPKGSYESDKMISISDLLNVFFDLEHNNGFQFFKIEFPANYYLVGLLLLVSIVYFVFVKDFLKALLFILVVFGFWAVVMTYTKKPDSPLNYQNYYCYLGLFIGVAFAYGPAQRLKPALFAVVIPFILLHSYYKIVKCGLKFQDRKEYELRCLRNLQKQNIRKAVFSDRNYFPETVWGSWDFCFESLFLSSLDSTGGSITFHSTANMNEFEKEYSTDKNIFMGVNFSPFWFSVNDVKKHSNYFSICDCYYSKVSTPQESSENDTLFNNTNIKIYLDNEYIALRHDVRLLKVIVENTTNVPFYSQISDNKQIRLSYRLRDMNDNVVLWEGCRTSLEMDIQPGSSIETGLAVELKNIARGKYQLFVDLVHEGKRWFNIDSKTILHVY